MVFDLRAVAIAASLILASIAVAAAAESAQDQPARPVIGASDHVGEAHPIRVILPAPWEPAPASSSTQTMVQK